MSATLSHVAERVGLSRHQVARILNGSAKGAWGSSAERALEIRAVAERLGYRPNAAARSMRSGRFNAVAMLYRPDEVVIPTELLIALGEELTQRDLHLQLSPLPLARLAAETPTPRTLRELCVDALLVHFMHHIEPAVVERVRAQRVPAVWLNLDDAHDCVRPDDAGAFAAATRQLLGLGHRRIALIQSDAWPLTPAGHIHFSVAARRDAYVATLAEAGLAARVVTLPTPGHALDDSTQRLRAVLTGEDRATALVVNQSAATAAVREVAAQLGLAIPGDLSVIAFAVTAPSEVGCRTSRLVMPWRRIAAAAVGMLHTRLHGRKRSLPSITVPFDPPARDSIAAAPARQ
jgi:DNA-binding LacI/PurR family transcriptional regulator